MSLAQLFYIKETFRERYRQWRQSCFRRRMQASQANRQSAGEAYSAPSPQRTALFPSHESRFTLESLEPRIMLSADLVFTTITDHNVTVLFDAVSDEIRIVDTAVPSTILAQQDKDDTSAVRVTGSNTTDHVTVDLATPFTAPVFFDDLNAADGDELSVVGSDAVLWNLSGVGEGAVVANNTTITFGGVENLSGDDANRDTFIIGDGGLLVGAIDAGASGFDSVVMRSAIPVTLTNALIDLGAVDFAIAGFEGAIFEAPSLNAAAFSGQALLTTGLSQWTSQGPGAVQAGQVHMPLQNDPVIGAVQDVVIHPFNLSSMYIGTVGGGVWKNSDISVLFEFGESAITDLTPEATARLIAFADFLKANPSLNVKIVGHTDDVGDQTMVNQPLSEARANTVKQFLLDQGIDASRLVASGKGELEPVDTNSTDAGRVNNRRVELLVNHWIPLTDQFPSLSVTSLAISPRDADGNLVSASTPTSKLVLYAGMGSTSSSGALFSQLGAQITIGILKSIDGGATWTLLDQMAGSKVTSIQVLPGAAPDGTLIVSTDAAGGNGLFVSTDGGQSFTDVADARGSDGVSNDGDADTDEDDEKVFDRAVSDLARDPSNPLRVYAAVPTLGVFVSNDGGVTWAATTNGNLQNVANASRIVLSTGPDRVYAALIGNGEALAANVIPVGATTFQVFANTALQAGDTITIFGAGADGVDNDRNNLAMPDDPAEAGLMENLTVTHVGAAIGGQRTVTVAGPGFQFAWGTAGVTVRFSHGLNNRLFGLFVSQDEGTNWTALPLPGTMESLANGGFRSIDPGAQGNLHMSIAVDPQNPDVIYAGGSLQPLTNGTGNTIGATDFTGRLFRFNGVDTWIAITDTGAAGIPGDGANGTAPHADSRNAVFRGMHIVEVSDGGIYELRNPDDVSRTWRSLIDDLSLTEFYSLAYDTINDVILGGTQDVGALLQSAEDSVIWNTVAKGDGAVVEFNNGNPIFSNPNLGSFTIGRAGTLAGAAGNNNVIFLPAGTDVRVGDLVTIGGFVPVVQSVAASTAVDVGIPIGSVKVTFQTNIRNDNNIVPAGTIAEIQPAGVNAGVAGARFTTPFVVNAITSSSLLIGTNQPFESTDVGRTLTALGTTTGTGGTDIGQIHALVYGGMEGGVAKPTVIWLGTNPNASSPQPADARELWVRNSGSAVGGAVSPVESYHTEVGNAVRGIAVDPTNWQRVWVLDAQGNVWFSPNAGQTAWDTDNNPVTADKFWGKISDGLSNLPGAKLSQQITVDRIGGKDVVLVGGQGGVFRKIDDGPWHEYGVGLPNAMVTSLDRIGGADDLLLAGTFGRGAWTLDNAGLTLAAPTVMTITGTAGSDEIVLRRNEAHPWLLDVFLFAGGESEPDLPSYSVSFANLAGITIDISGAGSDDVLIDGDFGSAVTTNATINVIGGGGGSDRLFITPTLDPGDVTFAGAVTGNLIAGSQASQFLDSFNHKSTQKVTWTNLNQVNGTVVAVPTVEGIANGLEALADALTNRLAGALEGITLPGIDAKSLAAALNGVIVDRLRPKDETFVTPSQVPGSDTIQIDNGTSVLLRLLEAGGLDIRQFTSGAVIDPTELEAALEALDVTSNNVSLSISDLPYDADANDDYLYEVQANGLVLDGVIDLSTLGNLELTGLLDVSMTLNLALAFGFDSTGFFIRTTGPVSPTIAITNLSISGEAVGVGTLGFLGVDMSKATLTLDPGVQLKFTLGDPGTVNDNLIRADELLSPPNPDELITFAALTDGDANADLVLNATLDVSAILPGIASGISLATADVKLTWNDITDPITVDLAAGATPGADIEEFLRFLEFDAQDVVNRLTMLRDNLEALYGAEIPYLSDSVSQLVGLVTAFQDKVLDPLTGGSGFEVPSIQALIRNLATSLGVTPDQLVLAYDKVTRELTYHLVFAEQIVDQAKSLGAGVDMAGGLADLEFNTDATVTAGVTFDAIVGLDLDLLADPTKAFFLRSASASADATLLATDVEASARFGFLSIGIDEGTLKNADGTGPAEVSLSVSLTDPGTTAADGRIDLAEILGNLDNLDDLVDVNFGGSLQLMLPVELPIALSGIDLDPIADGNPDRFDLPARSIIATIPDLANPSSFTVELGDALKNIGIGNFTNIDAASLVSTLGQLTYWFDEFRRSDTFKNLDLPLVGPALDKALQLADAFRDFVLIDDNDTQLDNDKTLLYDLNAALGDAGLGRKMFAANVGGKIGFFALDASIASFTVGGAGALGFAASQNGTVPGGKFFAEAVANSNFGNLQGDLGGDLSFTITIGTKVYAVEVAQSDNTTIGDDRWKLVNADNAATFQTAQQMAIRLLDAFGISYPGLSYDAVSQTLNFSIDLAPVFPDLDLPFSFDAANLPDFLKLQTSGALSLKVSGDLNLDLGVFLGNAEPSDKLQTTTALADLSQPVVINDNQRYDAQPIVGKLTSDAHFNVKIDGGSAVAVTVTKAATADNTTLVHLIADINAALTAAGLNAAIVAEQVPAVNGQPAPQQIQFRGLTVATSLEISAISSDAAVTEIGIAADTSTKKLVTGASPTLQTVKSVSPLKGQLTADAGFRVALTLGGVTTNFDVALTPAQTQDNDYTLSIINDIQAQLGPDQGPGARIKVGFSNGALTLSTLDGSSIAVSNVTGTATNELGIVAGSGNSDDLLIKLRDGSIHRVAFDRGDTTIQDIIDAIQTGTSSKVSVEINVAGSGLNLTENPLTVIPDGTSVFKAEILNNSTVGLLLGIIRQDAAEGETPDGIIEGAEIAALTALDRFFIKATPDLPDTVAVEAPLAGLSLEIGTPVPLTASATFGFVGLGLQGAGGLIGPGVTTDNNALQADLTLRLLEPVGSTDGRVSLAELIGALDDIDSMFDLSLTGQGQLDLSLTPATITSLSNLGIDVGTGPRIEIAADMSQNVFDGHAPVFTVTPQGFEELTDFGNLDFNWQSVINGLAALVDFLDEFEALGFLNDPIPVIDVSVKDLVGFAQQFADAVTVAENDPAGTLQALEHKLEVALGLPLDDPRLNLLLVDGPTPGSQVLKIDTELNAGFSKTLPLNLDLNLDPLELGGNANLLAQGSLQADLDFGFDITDPTKLYVFNTTGVLATLNLAATDLNFKAAVGPLGVFVKGGQATIHGTLDGSNTVLTAGFQGAFGTSGMALIGDIDFGSDLSVNVGGDLFVTLPVYFPTESIKAGTVQLDGSLGYSGGELTANLTPSAVGPDNDNPTPILLEDLFDFDPGNLSLLDQLLLGVDGVDFFLEGLQDLLDGSLGSFKLPMIGDKLSGAADAIGDVRNGFVEEFRKAIEDLANPALAFAEAGIEAVTGGAGLLASSVPQGQDPVSKLLWKLLGPTGLRVLDSQSDIIFDTNIQTETDPGKVFFDWRLQMGGTLVDAGAGIGFDLGIPGLGLETEGEVHLDVDWALDWGFGINFDDGFYVNLGDQSDLELTARVTTPGLGITGRLGFLQIEGHENVEADEGAGAENERGETGMAVQFAVDLYNTQDNLDQRLGFTELGRLGVDLKVAGEALVDLQLALKLNSDLVANPGNFPSVVADFAFDWAVGAVDDPDTLQDEFVGLSLTELDGSFLANGLEFIGFDDIGLDLGKYFSDVIGPIADKVQEVTEPIKPFLDFLTEPIPVISDLAGPTSLLDIASMSGFVNPGIIKAIEVVDQVVDIVSSLSVAGGTTIFYVDDLLPGGALTIYEAPPAGSFAAANASGIPGFDPSKPMNLANLKSFAGSLPDELGVLGDALKTATDVFSKSVAKMLPGGGVDAGFKIPIIEDPSQIFGMLLGQPADLVTFTMAPLELEAEFSSFFSIFGPLGVSINAEFSAIFGPFTFGYDTLGITEFAASDFRNPLALFNGLYVGDLDAQGIDIPELQFDAGLWAAAELNLGIARGGVGGGLFAEIDFNLYDPDDDGKVRVKELIASIANEFKYGEPVLSPLAIFDISGSLTAQLFAFIKVTFPPIDERFNITPEIELLSFENAFTRWPTLATELGDGVLQLNIGKNAAQRVEGDLSDFGEIIHVTQGSDADHVYVWSDELGVSFDDKQEYLASKLILAYGGEGDDTIDLSGVTSGVKYEIYGDAGGDTITAGTTGTGAALLVGGAGDDTLTGGKGGDTLIGGTGSDTLWGKDGNDWLIGDGDEEEYLVDSVITVKVKASDAKDELHGDDGDDLLIGAGDADKLWGGNHHDVLIGDGGQVTVRPDRTVATTRELDDDPNTNDPLRYELWVKDTAKNGVGGVDELRGEGGNDHLYGGFGNEVIMLGGADNDVIYGELGQDTIDGGDHDDIIFGDSGIFKEVTVGSVTTLEPFVTPGGEKDNLSGGAGNDKVLGGAGNDTMQGNDGNDSLWGGIGSDEIWGDSEGNVLDNGNDFLYGEADSDQLHSGSGDDYLEGGGGDDVSRGGDGLDILVGGYGSDTMDGEADSDTYRISVRGGTTTQLTTAYDSGSTGVDQIVIVGTPQADTLLLRAMADSYFPPLPKLNGLIERFVKSTLADRLAGIVQSFNDAYGPWDLPPGLVEALTHAYQLGVAPALKNAIDSANGNTDPSADLTLADLHDVVDEVLASNAVSKIDALKKAISDLYAKANNGAGVDVPNTLFSAVIAAYMPVNLSNDVQVENFINNLKVAIAPYYVAESLYPTEKGMKAIVDHVFATVPEKADLQSIVDRVYTDYPTKANLQAIVGEVYADTDIEEANRLDEIQRRVQVVYGGDFLTLGKPIVAAVQAAWDGLAAGASVDDQKGALEAAIAGAYDADADSAGEARFALIKHMVSSAYGDFIGLRDSMLTALQTAWNGLGAGDDPVAVLKNAISDTSDTDEADAADARFTMIRDLIEAAFVDRSEVSSEFATDEFSSQRSAMLAAVDAAWAALPADPSLAQQKAALTNAIGATYTVDPVNSDTFTNTAFVAVINNGGEAVERFNYRRMEGMVVNTLGGDDYVVFDDLLAAATINLGDGNDRTQVGQVFRSERVKDPEGALITGIRAEDVYTTVEITRGWLSNGVSVATTINGGAGEDNFTVFHNVATLNLNGGDDDDVFTVRAFALKGSSDNERARTDMKGDGGADTILYVVNAPVGIDGGDGFDTVRIVGTEFGDDFVVTDSGIFGAGLNVSYVNIERLVADGAEGDDRFFVQSTGLDVVTEIDGGLGSDTFFVGGNPSVAPVPVVSNDLRGHSGIVLHSVSAASAAEWAGIPIEGLSANVGDNEDAMILLTESGGRSLVLEGGAVAALATDTYRVRLSRAPEAGRRVAIAVVPAGLSPEDQARNYADLEVWDPTRNGGLGDWADSRTIYLDGANWDTGVEVMFRAKQDAGIEGRRFTFINHKITEETTDVTFLETQMRSLKVQMEDDDRDGVIIVPSGLGNTVLENGFTDTFDVVLSKAPTSSVAISMAVADPITGVSLSTSQLTFTPGNWNAPQTVIITALNDTEVEGFHVDYISFDVSSADQDQIKGPFINGQVVKVNGTDVTAVLDPNDGKVWLQIDADLDKPLVQELTPDKPSTFVLLPHRPIVGTVSVRIGGVELEPGQGNDPEDPNYIPPRFSVSGNTITFLTEAGAPEFRVGKVEVNYQYKESGYGGLEIRDQVVDIYDNDAPTVIVRPVGDGMIDVVEGDSSATDTYRVRLSSQPTDTVYIVIDSVKTRTTWGATAYFENQLLLSGWGSNGLDDSGSGDDEINKQQITLTFTPDNWDDDQLVTVRAFDDPNLDGNDTQVFAPDLQTVNKIRGPLIIEGAAGAGSLSLPSPLMMPWELNIRPSDGSVHSFQATTTPSGFETMTVELDDLLAVVDRFKAEDPSFTLQKLIGKTLEMSKGAGTDVVLDPSRPNDKFDRFWLITAVAEVDGEAVGEPQLVTLTLQNPTAVDPTQSNVIAPDPDSEYSITSLSVNFFADEREQVDYMFVYDNHSVADDVGALTSSDGVVLGFNAVTGVMTVETSALQRTADLLGLADLQSLANPNDPIELDITVGPGTSNRYTIINVSEEDGATKELTLALVSGAGVPTNRSEFRIEGSDRYGRIIGFGMGPNILFSGKPQGGGITYGDLEVVQVELGSGNDTVRVDYATNAEDHATKRTGDFYTQTILNTGAGNDQVTVTLANGDSTDSFNGSGGDGAFALNTGDGNDIVAGSNSTRQLVVFGGAGQDTIATGGGDDIVFGDIGRVDYTKKILVDGVEHDAVVTRLGLSVPQNPVNPHVTFATDTTITDSAIVGTAFEFPITDGGLVGLSVQVISPEGHVQFRTIVANTADTITVDSPWTEFPVYNATDRNDNYYYRISAYPDDQTDGVFRGPRVVWSVKESIGGTDTIAGGTGADTLIGGAGVDTIHGGAQDDWIAGDNARFDFESVSGNDGPTRIKTIHTTALNIGGHDILSGDAGVDIILGGQGGDQMYGDNAVASNNGGDGADVLIGDNGQVNFVNGALAEFAATDTDESSGGADVIRGNAGGDFILGGAAGDTIYGNNEANSNAASDGADIVIGDNGSVNFNGGYVGADSNQTTVDIVQATDPAAFAGSDTIYGNGSNDILIGGAAGDNMSGDAHADILLGDQGLVRFVNGVISYVQDPGTPGDDFLTGGDDVDLIIGGLGHDTISGLGAADILIGDDGEVFYATDGVTITKIDTNSLNPGNGGIDSIYGGDQDDVVIGGANDDRLDGGNQHDVIFGDNVMLVRNAGSGNAIDPRFRALTGTVIYGLDGLAQISNEFAAAVQPVPGGRPTWADWTITLDQSLENSHFGNDYIAGGAHNDEIFGQLGNDTVQGDGTIGTIAGTIPANFVLPSMTFSLAAGGSLNVTAPTSYGANRSGGVLTVTGTFEGVDDGDDYIEGNGGTDVLFGNLGQDDLIGGSSNLFSLTTSALRPDGTDFIFGGAGTDIARNDTGDAAASGHARDSDMILGDNGNIFRLVGITGVVSPQAAYLQFSYDNYGTLKIIPRAAQLLDYTSGGSDFNAVAGNDLGEADELHGESGDDFIYGMKGNDVLFGEGQDDDLIGGYGNDWISGGTGEDGVLGDDGRISTSRNGTAEALYGIAAAIQQDISTPGKIQQATINVTGQLKKTVNLTPFSVDPTWPLQNTIDEFGGAENAANRPHKSDDVIYGGWGNDFLHGGSGDDAMSGAEALPSFYASPVNPGDVLGYADRRAGEFAAYDEFDPLAKIAGFLLNFDAAEGPLVSGSTTIHTDGNDVLFGDTGNDWLVGGTGRDNLYGGWGDDLLNTDDDLETNGGANTTTDSHVTYEDRAYGGAGRDVLIGNTGGDRLIDWVGEFNSYIVPFAPFGAATISRTLQPQLPEFLYALSKADGADPTRASDTGADALRNGEPVGELGLVLQKDFSWKAQTGAPADPQAGNIPGGPRDVLRSSNFNGNQAQGFVPDTGTWTVTNGRYEVAPSVAGGDAVSVFYVDSYIPKYFEILATINAVKPTGGTNANAYVIFDYQSPTNFKFAGVNVSTNKLEIGYRNASGWIVSVQGAYPGSVKSGTDYNMLLSFNGSAVTLTVNNQVTLTHTYAPRVDVYGINHGLNEGMVGLGAKNAKAQIDNVTVQRVAPVTTLNTTVDFSNGTTGLFQVPLSGTWTVTNGLYVGATVGSGAAIDLTSIKVGSSSLIDVATTLKTTGEGGFIFDAYTATDYKFVTISSGKITLGHSTTNKGVMVDATYNNAGVVTGSNYTLGLTLKGTTVSVTLNGSLVASRAYNALVTDGGIGLLSRTGATSFDTVTVKSDDPAFSGTTPATLIAAGGASVEDETLPELTEAQLAPIVDAATARWIARGLTAEQTAALVGLTVTIVDLDGATLGLTEGAMIRLDRTAAGHGWFLDPTPHDDVEFRFVHGLSQWVAQGQSPAFGRIDLLTTVMHEMGHVLGFSDHQSVHPMTATLMTDTLPDSVRRMLGTELAGTGSVGALRVPEMPTARNLSDRTPEGFELKHFQGLFNSGSQQGGASVRGAGVTRPVIEWTDEDTLATPTSVSLGWVKTKSSWLSKFLCASDLKEDRAVAQDFEVTLPKRK